MDSEHMRPVIDPEENRLPMFESHKTAFTAR
jgi:hypothetical protein